MLLQNNGWFGWTGMAMVAGGRSGVKSSPPCVRGRCDAMTHPPPEELNFVRSDVEVDRTLEGANYHEHRSSEEL